jgi:hypothetical protein
MVQYGYFTDDVPMTSAAHTHFCCLNTTYRSTTPDQPQRLRSLCPVDLAALIAHQDAASEATRAAAITMMSNANLTGVLAALEADVRRALTR